MSVKTPNNWTQVAENKWHRTVVENGREKTEEVKIDEHASQYWVYITVGSNSVNSPSNFDDKGEAERYVQDYLNENSG